MSEASMQTYLAIEHGLPQRRRVVYRAILDQGGHGATIADLERRTGLKPHQISGRLTELERAGLIWNTGERRTGQTVYAITADGQRTEPGRKQPRHLRGEVVEYHSAPEFGAYRILVEVRRWGAGRKPPSPKQKVVLTW